MQITKGFRSSTRQKFIAGPPSPRCCRSMKRVTSIGGIFFKSDNPDKLCEWYREHLGIESNENGCANFYWRKPDDPKSERFTVWSPFPADTDYFAPSKKAFMINFQVENLEDLRSEEHTSELQSRRDLVCRLLLEKKKKKKK